MAKKEIIIFEWGRWLGLRQASLYCDSSPTQLRRYIKSGLLNISRIRGGHPKVDRHELDKLYERHKFNYKTNEKRLMES
ncbi:MAG: hypothetical protein A2Y94_02065 [Caldithrix sp. RBG_13_44_9]|nr:MAG: hypothetical protein A2Y94_02065 [Caldithrix sp. RBG_13_44_9]